MEAAKKSVTLMKIPLSCLRAVALFAAVSSFAAEPVVIPAHEVKEPTFRNHIQSVLTKAGCNMGACHGAAAGKNGFLLSLRGYNSEADHIAIIRNSFGRRIVPSDPGRSLLLTKPTGAVPHKGGKRFEVDSPEYRVIAEWIAAGAPGPKENDPKLLGLAVQPALVKLAPGATQQVTVHARFSDGRVEDVTRWAKFTSANEGVANVNDTGLASIVGYGGGAISAWYLSQIAIATVTSPYESKVPAETFANAPRQNFIDDLVLEKLAELNLPPSAPTTDSEFIRRAFLDTIGLLPTAKEVRDFLAADAATKRADLIEKLLERPEFVDYWTYKWSDLLLVSSARLNARAVRSYYLWVRRQVELNTPWDKLVRSVVTAQGSTFENGAANFFVLHDDPRTMAETATQAFMGMSVGCAKCHNHPMEKWTNDDYFALANHFSRVRAKNGAADGERILVASRSGDLIQPRTGKPQNPRPLDGKALDPEATSDRREPLADWLVSPENPYFTKAIVNRVWANFLGVGLVEKVDDLRVTNPASNEKLLSAAAKFLADNRYDLKKLMRAILQSATYQRSSKSTTENAGDTRFYSRCYPKRLMAEVLLDATSQATGAPTKFDGHPDGWRALQLADSNVASYFLKSFGRPERIQTCECERTAEPSVAQVLHMANGTTMNQKLSAKGNRLEQMLTDKWPAEKIIEEAYLGTVCRLPGEAEKAKLTKLLAEADEKDKRPVLEDIYWALLSSKEFLFNH
jgi:hypothetical protein